MWEVSSTLSTNMFMLFLAMNFGRQEATDCSVASSSSDFIKEVGFADNIDNNNSRLTDVDVKTNNALCLMKVWLPSLYYQRKQDRSVSIHQILVF